MLRRLIEGAGLVLLVVLFAYRVDIGFMIPLLAIGAIVWFTAWRIRKVWNRYQACLVSQQSAGPRNATVDNEMHALRGQQHGRGAELTFWTGFMLGGAMLTDHPAHGGEGGDGPAAGLEGGIDIGGFGGDL